VTFTELLYPHRVTLPTVWGGCRRAWLTLDGVLRVDRRGGDDISLDVEETISLDVEETNQ